jgi:hypothetical protein
MFMIGLGVNPVGIEETAMTMRNHFPGSIYAIVLLSIAGVGTAHASSNHQFRGAGSTYANATSTDSDLLSVLGVPDWSDNFDSYTTGSQIHGQGGWKGWANDPSAGALISSAQSVSTPNSVAIVGASDLVHPFTGYTSGVYTLTAKQFIPTGFSGKSYFIVQNRYNDAGTNLSWSVQVKMDNATGLISNDDDGTPANPGSASYLTNQWVDLKVVIDLDADYQEFYYNNTLLYDGSWTAQFPPNVGSTAGTLTIGALDLYANSASVVYYDDISLVVVLPDLIFANGFD